MENERSVLHGNVRNNKYYIQTHTHTMFSSTKKVEIYEEKK